MMMDASGVQVYESRCERQRDEKRQNPNRAAAAESPKPSPSFPVGSSGKDQRRHSDSVEQ